MRDLDQLRRDIGEHIANLRRNKGLSRSVLCRNLTVSQHTLYKIEKGKAPNPRLSTVHDIVTALGVDLSDVTRIPGVDDPSSQLRELLTLVRDLDENVVADVVKAVRSLLKS